MTPPDPNTFGWRLAETMAWSAAVFSQDHPVDSLRTPGLLPEGFGYERTNEGYVNIKPPLWQRGEISLTDALDNLAQRRAQLLKSTDLYPVAPATSLDSGRLLAFAPDSSLNDGAAQAESHGYFDAYDIPPWDTWICFVEGRAREADRDELWHYSYIVCWVHPKALPLADAGIRVNIGDCMRYTAGFNFRIVSGEGWWS